MEIIEIADVISNRNVYFNLYASPLASSATLWLTLFRGALAIFFPIMKSFNLFSTNSSKHFKAEAGN